jgi:hypothetical protein
MDSTDHDDREPPDHRICGLEWIALAMDAARRYKEAERRRSRGVRPPDDDDPNSCDPLTGSRA